MAVPLHRRVYAGHEAKLWQPSYALHRAAAISLALLCVFDTSEHSATVAAADAEPFVESVSARLWL